jgi:hypothetical protein
VHAKEKSLLPVVKRHRRALIYIALLVAIFFVGFGYGMRQPIAKQFHAWKLLPQEEQFSELYFDDSPYLPKTYGPGLPQSFTFEVHSLENIPTTYRYEVFAESSAGVDYAVDNGVFAINPGQRHAQRITANMPDLGSRVRIVVRLSSTQSVHYWVTKEAAK